MPTALVGLLLCVTVASVVIGKAARDAIFLSRFSAHQMTVVDLVTIVATATVVAAQLRLHARSSTKRVLVVSPLCFALGDVALWLGLRTSQEAGVVAWAAYLWIGVQAAVGVPHAFVMTNRVLTIRQTKHWSGPIGCGAILGWIGGGFATEIVAARYGAPSLLLVTGLLTAVCPVIVALAWPESLTSWAHTSGSLWRSASVLWQSRHLRAIAWLVFASSAVTTIVGLQFKAIASQSIHSVDDLATFFGSFSLYSGLVALVMQAFVTPRVLNRLGLGAALAIAPVAVAGGSVGVLLSGTLAAAAILKGSDQILRYSVDRAGLEMLYRPLPPDEMFERKMVIDALVGRLGDAAGALLAFAVVVALHASFSMLSLVNLAAITLWLASTTLARAGYRSSLLNSLGQIARPWRARPIADVQDGAETRRRRSGWLAILEPEAEKRLAALRALTRPPAGSPRRRRFHTRLATALAIEIVAFAVLVETACGPAPSAGAHRKACRESIERISRLLFLMSPANYPRYLLESAGSRGAALEAAALEYLDTTLASPHREILVPLLERWTIAAR